MVVRRGVAAEAVPVQHLALDDEPNSLAKPAGRCALGGLPGRQFRRGVLPGPVGAAEALQRSLNVRQCDMLDRVGPNRFVARLANGRCRSRPASGPRPNLSIILGGASSGWLAGRAYTAFADGRIAGTPRSCKAQLRRARAGCCRAARRG
ncbi:hypothetical protein [Rhodanobacter lindaniclasticus]